MDSHIDGSNDDYMKISIGTSSCSTLLLEPFMIPDSVSTEECYNVLIYYTNPIHCQNQVVSTYSWCSSITKCPEIALIDYW